MVIEPAFGSFGSVGRCSNSPNSVGSPNHHWLWKLHTGLQETWILCLSSLPPDSGTLISKWNAKFTLIWKEDFGPLSPVIFLFSPGKMLLTMFLVQKWLGLSVVTLDALTPASVHSLWSSPKCLDRLWLTVFSSLLSSLLLVHIFLPKFFLPVNFAFNMLWYSTPWTATSFSNDPLCLILFVEGVNDRLLDHCQVSSVPHYCGFKEQEIPTIYTVWMVIYWNSNVNILIFWDTDIWLSLAVSSNHQNKKNTFEVFYFTCNESKIYQSFTFWNKLQEKINFFSIFF